MGPDAARQRHEAGAHPGGVSAFGGEDGTVRRELRPAVGSDFHLRRVAGHVLRACVHVARARLDVLGAALDLSGVGHALRSTPAETKFRGPVQRLAWLQGAMRRSSRFKPEVRVTPRTISTNTGTNVLSISNTLAYLVIMKPRPEIVV